MKSMAKVFLVGILATLPPEWNAASQSYGDRDTDFRITLRYITEPHGIEARIVTTNTYPCEGYGIRSYATWDRDTVNLRIFGLVQPSPCIQSMSEAEGTAFLGDLRDSTYIVKIYYRGDVDMHRVKFSGGRIMIRPVRSDFTRVNGY